MALEVRSRRTKPADPLPTSLRLFAASSHPFEALLVIYCQSQCGRKGLFGKSLKLTAEEKSRAALLSDLHAALTTTSTIYAVAISSEHPLTVSRLQVSPTRHHTHPLLTALACPIPLQVALNNHIWPLPPTQPPSA
jgi:hypothetical protein